MKDYSRVLLILLIPLLVLMGYAYSDSIYTINLEKIDVSGVAIADTSVADSGIVLNPASPVADGKKKIAPETKPAEPDTVPLDTASQRILFFGDSMVEGLGPRMAQYAAANGHDLTYICWYSSNTKLWSTDTLQYYINQVKPTYVMMTIGGNEQFVRDLKDREENIRKILSMVGDIPYVWICTPAWKEGVEFNEIPARLAGKKRFFDSRKLTFERGKDHCHPTFSSARVWMDSIAVWMQSQRSSHPIVMRFPPEGTPKKSHSIYLQPMNQ